MSIMAKHGKCFSCGHDHDAAPHWLAKLDQDQKKLKAATSKLAELQRALALARETIQRDRDALYSAHFDYAVCRVNDDLGQQGIDEYDAVLAAIDRSLSGGEG